MYLRRSTEKVGFDSCHNLYETLHFQPVDTVCVENNKERHSISHALQCRSNYPCSVVTERKATACNFIQISVFKYIFSEAPFKSITEFQQFVLNEFAAFLLQFECVIPARL